MGKTLSSLLYLAAVVSGLLCVYRLVILMQLMDFTNTLVMGDNISLIAFLAAMAPWCWKLGSYKAYADMQKATPETPLAFYSDMKTLSLFAGISCLVHLGTSLLYFLQMKDGNLVTTAYVCGELALWLILGAFLLLYSFSSKKAADDIAAIMSEYGGINI